MDCVSESYKICIDSIKMNIIQILRCQFQVENSKNDLVPYITVAGQNLLTQTQVIYPLLEANKPRT